MMRKKATVAFQILPERLQILDKIAADLGRKRANLLEKVIVDDYINETLNGVQSVYNEETGETEMVSNRVRYTR